MATQTSRSESLIRDCIEVKVLSEPELESNSDSNPNVSTNLDYDDRDILENHARDKAKFCDGQTNEHTQSQGATAYAPKLRTGVPSKPSSMETQSSQAQQVCQFSPSPFQTIPIA